MKRLTFLFLLCLSQSLRSQTTVQTFSNAAAIDVQNEGTGSVYPSEITVSGMPAYLHHFMVRFNIAHTASLREVDMLLVAPGGQQLVLMSDLPYDATHAFYDVGIGTKGTAVVSQINIDDHKNLLPGNYETTPDDFPAPGPGLIAQPNPDAFSLQDIDPNGVWKLYIVDDKSNISALTMNTGWKIVVEAGSQPACKNPSALHIDSVGDFSARIGWTPGAGNTLWDIYLTEDLLFSPDKNTLPTWNDLSDYQQVNLHPLLPGTEYKVFIRADCGNGYIGDWRGGLTFETEFHPCEYAVPAELCTIFSDTTLPYFRGFVVDKTYREWTFSFTPPHPGDYWVRFMDGNYEFPPLYHAADTCSETDWVEAGWEGQYGSAFKLSNLSGGQTYWLLHRKVTPTPLAPFQIMACPLRPLGIFDTYAYPDSAQLFWANFPALLDTLEFYYGAAPLAAPDDNTVPTVSDVVLPANGKFSVTNLIPATAYNLYVRKRCDASLAGCWQGPFAFKTADLCNVIDSFHLDTITASWARFYFTWTGQAPVIWKARFCLPGQNPNFQYLVQTETDNAHPDSLYWQIGNIPSYQPLQLYLKAGCTDDFQRWQGPYLLPASNTPPVPVQTIYCGEEHSTFSGLLYNTNFLYVNNPCAPKNSSLSEELFLYRAVETDTVKITHGGGVGGSSDGSGIAFFVKPASVSPGNQGWSHLGCWKFDSDDPHNPANYPSLPFTVQKDSSYYILCDGFDVTAGHFPGVFDFYIQGCVNNCPPVDTIIKVASTSASIGLKWSATIPGAIYAVRYKPVYSGEAPFEITGLTDTTLLLTGLEPALEYECWVRAICPSGGVGSWKYARFYTGENPVFTGDFINRCNPRLLPPAAGSTLSHFDVYPLEVPVSGEYFIAAGEREFYIYENSFDANTPAEHLLAGVFDGYLPQNFYRPDTLLFLEAGRKYFLLVFGYGIWIDGPAKAVLGPPTFNQKGMGAHGRAPDFFSGFFLLAHNYVCRDTAGWVHFYAHSSDPTDVQKDWLLFSVENYPTLDAGPVSAAAFVFNGPGASRITNPPAGYLQNPDGWYTMNRIWNYDLSQAPLRQPEYPVKIRQYYTDSDFADLQDSIEAAGGTLGAHEDLFFYKINGIHGFDTLCPWLGHPGVPAATAFDNPGYWEYKHGDEATASTWRHGTYANFHYAEMLIRWFSGGGGGATVNGKSVFNPVSKTKELGANAAFTLSPNPNTGVFNLEWASPAEPGTTCRITDPGGRLWWKKPAVVGSKRQTVLAGDLPAGLYFLQVTVEGKVLAVGKFVKQ